MRRNERMALGLAALLLLGMAGARENPVSLPPVAQATRGSIEYDAVLGACQFVEPQAPIGGSAINSIAPLGPVGEYLKFGPDDQFFGETPIVVLTQPQHGTIQYISAQRFGGYYYSPAPGYRGRDEAVFDVEANDKRFKVIYTVIVVDNVDHVSPRAQRLCPKPGVGYRISQISKMGSGNDAK